MRGFHLSAWLILKGPPRALWAGVRGASAGWELGAGISLPAYPARFLEQSETAEQVSSLVAHLTHPCSLKKKKKGLLEKWLSPGPSVRR